MLHMASCGQLGVGDGGARRGAVLLPSKGQDLHQASLDTILLEAGAHADAVVAIEDPSAPLHGKHCAYNGKSKQTAFIHLDLGRDPQTHAVIPASHGVYEPKQPKHRY
eukprot:11190295-Lingulodinium_polyedra.AAC.1